MHALRLNEDIVTIRRLLTAYKMISVAGGRRPIQGSPFSHFLMRIKGADGRYTTVCPYNFRCLRFFSAGFRRSGRDRDVATAAASHVLCRTDYLNHTFVFTRLLKCATLLFRVRNAT